MANRTYTSTTIKILFGSSGNECAHPNCINPVITAGTERSDDAVMAQICHIYAASDNGPRGNPELTDEERNSPNNLILLCGFHHTLVDSQYKDYPADLLKQWKREHESKFQPGTAEAIQRQNQIQQNAFTVKLTDQHIENELLQIRQARHLEGYPRIAKAQFLAASVEKSDFSGGSSATKAKALAWCARILSQDETLIRAKELLAKSRDLGGALEANIASAFITAVEVKSIEPALSLLAPMRTPESLSAMLRIVSNDKGVEGALDWVQSAGLTLNSFDSDGKLNLIMLEEFAGRWGDAYVHVQQLTPIDFEETPVLNFAAAQAHLAQVIPEELWTQKLFQIPFDALHFPLADDHQARHDRKCAIEFYEKQAILAEKFGVIEAAQLSFEMALWLRLRDPDLRDNALEILRENMRDEILMLRRFPLAVQFSLNVDLDAVERRINERVALTGKGSVNEAMARFALAITKKSPAAAVEYLAIHREQLYEFLEHSSLLCMEVELLCRSGQVETAKAKLAETPLTDLGDSDRERLQRIIAEAEGSDPSTERRKLYEKTGELRDQVSLVNFLENEKAWQELCLLAEDLFDKTRSTEDAFRVARAFDATGEYRRALEFLRRIPEIVEQDWELQSLLAWELYRDGQFCESSKILTSLRTKRDNVNDRVLFVNLAIASGQWEMLIEHTTREWEQKDQRSAEELLHAGQLAQAVNAPHARNLIVAATKVASDDPCILASAYFHAANAGWENDSVVSDWLLRAAEKSDEEGPLKSISMKELTEELKPDWDRRQDQIYTALNAGEITISGAAYVLNQSMIQNCLLRPAANRQEADARRRSLVYAFSGARPSIIQIEPKRIALDLTAIFTFAQLGLLPTLIAHFDRVLIPDQLLVWLFQERRRVAFHQPSRVKNAQLIRRLLAEGILQLFIVHRKANASFAHDVGFDLASMLESAVQSSSDAYVIRSSPVHRVGSVMEEEVDLKTYESHLRSCQALVDALFLKGMITRPEMQRALSYLRLHERRWSNEPCIADGATLYLDDLSTSYLLTAGVLEKLKGAGFTVYVTKSLDEQNNQLLAYQNFAEDQLTTIENIRAVFTSALADGQVEAIASTNREGNDPQLQAQLNFLATDKQVDAFIVDDRFVNRYLHMTRDTMQTPILNSLDVIEQLVASGSLSIDERWEHRTTLRRSGYTFVPVLEEELAHHLMHAPLNQGKLVETAELRAIRESTLRLRLANVLQAPLELAWLDQYTKALIYAVGSVWDAESDPKTAEARCEWLLRQLDIRGWASIFEKHAAAHYSVTAYAGILHVLSFLEVNLKRKNGHYHRWVDERILKKIKETEPEIFDQVIASAARLIDEIAKEDLEKYR